MFGVKKHIDRRRKILTYTLTKEPTARQDRKIYRTRNKLEKKDYKIVFNNYIGTEINSSSEPMDYEQQATPYDLRIGKKTIEKEAKKYTWKGAAKDFAINLTPVLASIPIPMYLGSKGYFEESIIAVAVGCLLTAYLSFSNS